MFTGLSFRSTDRLSDSAQLIVAKSFILTESSAWTKITCLKRGLPQGISFSTHNLAFQPPKRVEFTQGTTEDSMTKISRTVVAVALLSLAVTVFSGSASAATHYYVVANNNASPTNSVSVYQVSGTSLVSLTTVSTGGAGSGGGYFAAVTQSIAHDGTNTCVFAGDAGSADISAMKVISTSPFSKRRW